MKDSHKMTEIFKLIKEIEQQVTTLLEQYREQLTKLAETLLDKETLEAGDIKQLVMKRPEQTRTLK